MSQYDELKRLAEAAPEGPWTYWGESANEIFQASGHLVLIIAHDQSVPACKFIAAANPAAVLALIAENERLALANHARDSLITKIQDERDQLKAENEALRNALTECADSLHGEMLQKFGGQLPDDMHPVTRREYDRDIAEVSGYRAALGQGDQS